MPPPDGAIERVLEPFGGGSTSAAADRAGIAARRAHLCGDRPIAPPKVFAGARYPAPAR